MIVAEELGATLALLNIGEDGQALGLAITTAHTQSRRWQVADQHNQEAQDRHLCNSDAANNANIQKTDVNNDLVGCGCQSLDPGRAVEVWTMDDVPVPTLKCRNKGVPGLEWDGTVRQGMPLVITYHEKALEPGDLLDQREHGAGSRSGRRARAAGAAPEIGVPGGHGDRPWHGGPECACRVCCWVRGI